MKRHNLHTHTTYSDGQNSPSELISKAIEEGLEVIGISDHGFTRKINSLDGEEVLDYIRSLKQLRDNFVGIDIKIGLEVDTCKGSGIDPEKVPFKIINQLDYVLFEYIKGISFYNPGIYRSLDSIVKIRKELAIPVGLAHPNLDEDFPSACEDVAKILGENDIFVDLPLNDFKTSIRYNYSSELLGYLREYNVKFTIGTDVHSRKDLVGNIEPAWKYILDNQLNVHEMVI